MKQLGFVKDIPNKMNASRAEWLLMLVGIPLFMMANYAGNGYYNQPFSLVAGKLTAVLILAIIMWLWIRILRNYFRNYFYGPLQAIKRISASVLAGSVSGMIPSLLLTEPLSSLSHPTFPLLVNHFGPMFFYAVLVVSAHEVVHNIFDMQKLEQEREALKKAHIQMQLDSLKNQVNPHFLFNSLNTLSSLVSIAPEQAELFIEELSSVYRYLLQSNEKELTTLRAEMQFVNSYFHLLKTRFGEGIQLTTSIDDTYIDALVPSLSLQLLLENTTKHNIISTQKPLHIHIYTDAAENRLVVKNNLQKKLNPVPSNKTGLANIMKKLQLLNQPEVKVRETETDFIVSLPLIKQQ